MIPIFIITCDRLEVLQDMIESYKKFIKTPFEIIIVDFGSTYNPTIKYLKQLESKKVKVYWKEKIRVNTDLNRVDEAVQDYFKTHPASNYVVTDPDIALDNVEGDILDVYTMLLKAPAAVRVIGPMLRIDDIPDYNPEKEKIQLHSLHADFHAREKKEYQYDGRVVRYISAPIDTTFGMYRAGMRWTRLNNGWRVLSPYSARHLSWYLDPNNQSPDQVYYVENASKKLGNWSMWDRKDKDL